MTAIDPGAEEAAPREVSAARAALRVPAFRAVWLGAFGSGIGTWMQQVVLGAFAYELTGSASFVSLTVFAHLGPVLVLSIAGGALADTFDRRALIVGSQLAQGVASLVLAAVVAGGDPSRVALLTVIFLSGVAHAVEVPAWTALVPSLVPPRHLAGAVSLQSTQMNASRVVGPAIAGVLYPAFGAAAVFVVNGLSYGCSIASMRWVGPSRAGSATDGSTAWGRVAEGLAVARRDPLVRRVLVVIVAFSLLCLPFVGQLPTHAAESFGVRPKSFTYGSLYAAFGVGAVVGAASIGTFLSQVDLRVLFRRGLLAFAVLLALFALLPSVGPAYPVVAALGFAFFATVTSLSTVLQQHVPDRLRGRVMSLWQMGYAGVAPLGLLAAGPVADATSIRVVLLYGAAAAVALAAYWSRPTGAAPAPPAAPVPGRSSSR